MASPKIHTVGRSVGGTEHSWCRAVTGGGGGTGIVVLAFLFSKPLDVSVLQNDLRKLQMSHPILRTRLHFDASTKTFSFVTSPLPFTEIKSFDISSTSRILLSKNNNNSNSNTTPFYMILEHELNNNTWLNLDRRSLSHNDDDDDADLFFASIYALPDKKWVATLRLHTAACDRTAAVSLLRELLEVLVKAGGEKEVVGKNKGDTKWEKGNKGEVSLGIENLVPSDKSKKPLWARGMDMLGYSMNSFRLTNLKFKDTKSPRFSEVVRLQMDLPETSRLLSGCKSRGIKLCGALAAAGLIAAHLSKTRPDRQQKYGVVTLTDCRSILEPALSVHNFGFYHSAILNMHAIKGGEKLWDVAKKSYMAFSNSKSCNKHFSDMADLNFLMCRAIENPGLTSSSSLRTSLISVFEDPVIDDSTSLHKQLGLEDYMGCASVHGIGPSIAIFDTIQDGQLDCVCVYPSPLHSREQMQELVDQMKTLLVDASNFAE